MTLQEENISVSNDYGDHLEIETTINIYVDVTRQSKKRKIDVLEEYIKTAGS